MEAVFSFHLGGRLEHDDPKRFVCQSQCKHESRLHERKSHKDLQHHDVTINAEPLFTGVPLGDALNLYWNIIRRP